MAPPWMDGWMRGLTGTCARREAGGRVGGRRRYIGGPLLSIMRGSPGGGAAWLRRPPDYYYLLPKMGRPAAARFWQRLPPSLGHELFAGLLFVFSPFAPILLLIPSRSPPSLVTPGGQQRQRAAEAPRIVRSIIPPQRDLARVNAPHCAVLRGRSWRSELTGQLSKQPYRIIDRRGQGEDCITSLGAPLNKIVRIEIMDASESPPLPSDWALSI